MHTFGCWPFFQYKKVLSYLLLLVVVVVHMYVPLYICAKQQLHKKIREPIVPPNVLLNNCLCFPHHPSTHHRGFQSDPTLVVEFQAN